MGCDCCTKTAPRRRLMLETGRPEKPLPPPKFGYLKHKRCALSWSPPDKACVLAAWPVAFRMLSESVGALRAIRATPRKTREAAWDNSPARRWFGSYSAKHLNIALRYARRAHRKLRHGWVICFRFNLPDSGSASYGSRAIWLKNDFFKTGELWPCGDPPPPNITYEPSLRNADTIVHELIHTVGKTLGDTDERYGRRALRLPSRQAIRNAANHAGFAMDVYVDTALTSKSRRWRACLKTVYLDAHTPKNSPTAELDLI